MMENEENEPKIGENRLHLKNKGNAGKGRPLGAKNKMTSVMQDAHLLMQDAFIESCIEIGGKEGMKGYFKKTWKRCPSTHLQYGMKSIPMEVKAEGSGTLTFTISPGELEYG